MAELDAESLSRRRRIRASIATGTVLVVVLLLLRLCGPGGPTGPAERVGREGAEPAVSAGPPGAGAPPAGAPGAGKPSVTAGPPAAAEVARVETLLGDASASAPRAVRRALACGDPVYEGDRVSTAPEARVGLLRDETYAQLGSASAVRVGLTPKRALDVTLEAGAVRVVDAREAGPPFRLAVSDAEVALVGGDADAYAASGGAPALLCTRGAQCLSAVAGEAPGVAAAPAERLALPQSASEECAADIEVDTAYLLDPTEVGAGPDDWLFPNQDPERPERWPCDEPGSGCNALAASGGPGDDPPGPPGEPPKGKAWALGPFLLGPPPGTVKPMAKWPPGQVKQGFTPETWGPGANRGPRNGPKKD